MEFLTNVCSTAVAVYYKCGTYVGFVLTHLHSGLFIYLFIHALLINKPRKNPMLIGKTQIVYHKAHAPVPWYGSTACPVALRQYACAQIAVTVLR